MPIAVAIAIASAGDERGEQASDVQISAIAPPMRPIYRVVGPHNGVYKLLEVREGGPILKKQVAEKCQGRGLPARTVDIEDEEVETKEKLSVLLAIWGRESNPEMLKRPLAPHPTQSPDLELKLTKLSIQNHCTLAGYFVSVLGFKLTPFSRRKLKLPRRVTERHETNRHGESNPVAAVANFLLVSNLGIAAVRRPQTTPDSDLRPGVLFRCTDIKW
ncbi:hypothetical protein C8R46DRAFT_1040943 [Mycena filopes]|nr:hypothetical protein C8R46DRAFT_1040943 [Mycena filopes]